jgi:hypothetical protein
MASREEWELLLRRSLGIPDLIGKKTAEAVLADRALGDHSADKALRDWNNHDPADIGKKISREIAKLGEAGRLDRTIIGLPPCDTIEETAHKVTSGVLGGTPNLVAEFEKAGGGALPLLLTLKPFILAHPFVASCGCYFGDLSGAG